MLNLFVTKMYLSHACVFAFHPTALFTALGILNIMKCPHLSWVPRKPEPLGVELKTVGDALSGIMLRIEICEGN